MSVARGEEDGGGGWGGGGGEGDGKGEEAEEVPRGGQLHVRPRPLRLDYTSITPGYVARPKGTPVPSPPG